jgi:lipid A disaccharide synthetase
LPNLILNKGFLREFVMDEMKYSLVRPEAEKLIGNTEYREAISKYYDQLDRVMGDQGASDRAASQMVEILNVTHSGI